MAIRKLLAMGAAVPLLVAGGMVAATATSSAQTVPSGGQAPLTSTQARALSTNVDHRVIVVLKDQVTADPASRAHVNARRSVESSEQSPVVSELRQTAARNVHAYTTINAVAATVSAGEQARLAANPAVAEVVPDQIIHLAAPTKSTPDTSAASRTPLANACSTDPSKPELAPEALDVMHVDSDTPGAKTARSLGIDGSGVTVAYIADGVDTNDPDFIRANGQHVFTDYEDFTGTGTGAATGGEEAFIDSSSIAAQGRESYDVSDYSALPLDRPCYVRVEGVAPGANLVGLIAFTGDSGFNSTILQSIDYAVSVDHVQVLNESFGSNQFPDDDASFDLIKQADEAATAAGTTVTVSSGDAGITNTIGSPSDDPAVIGVGGSTTYAIDSQLGYGGFQFPGVDGFIDDNISAISSSGYSQTGTTVSAIAPSELNWVLCSLDTAQFNDCLNFNGDPTPVLEGGGTSESAPLTAGVAALVIQAYEKTHSGTAPTPALVKQFITSTADDVNAPADLQGSGLVDAYRAVLAAEAYQVPAPAGAPNTLLESTSQFNSVAPAGTIQRFTENFTNEGSTSQRIHLGTRTLGGYHTIKTASVTLDDTNSPHSTDYQGINDNYETVQFNVPRGVDRLNGSIAFQGASADLTARVRLALVDPLGRLADYSVPQGVGNYGTAQVSDPTPGTWTAYIWSRDSADGGTTGPVEFGASVANYQPFGLLSASRLTIPAGATRSVTMYTITPFAPGDVSGSIVATPDGQTALAIPVTLRTLAPRDGRFSGVLTGGNGREASTGVTEYYQFDLRRSEPALNAYVTLGTDPTNQVSAWLVDPNGQAEAYQSNSLITEDSQGNLDVTDTLGTNLHVVDPTQGRWTLIVDFAPTVAGNVLSEPYSIRLDERPAAAVTSAPTVGQTIDPAHPLTVDITVTNRGSAPEAYFVDGRTTADGIYNLPSLTSADTQAPLTFNDPFPEYLVPSETSSITATASTTGNEPIQFDMSSPAGDPDIASNQGLSTSATVGGSPLAAGLWSVLPSVVGPFTGTAATTEDTSTTMSATTRAFDPSISSSTGDLWWASVGAPIPVSPIVVQPGQSTVIPVTITPQASAGTTVTGTIFLDDDSLYLFGGLAPNANTVAAFPYSYTVSN